MKCEHPMIAQLQTQDHSMVCGECGCVLRHVFTPEYMVGYDSWKLCAMSVQYTRAKRFETLLNNVVLGLENKLDFNVLTWIGNSKRTFSNSDDITTFLKTIPFTDKRYCSLHLLSRAFCNTYQEPPPKLITRYYRDRTLILSMFKQVEHTFFRTYCGPFLNYKFILMCILYTFDLDYFVRYVKPIKSIARIKYNISVWNTLHIMHGDRAILIPDTVEAIEKYCGQPVVNRAANPSQLSSS